MTDIVFIEGKFKEELHLAKIVQLYIQLIHQVDHV